MIKIYNYTSAGARGRDLYILYNYNYIYSLRSRSRSWPWPWPGHGPWQRRHARSASCRRQCRRRQSTSLGRRRVGRETPSACAFCMRMQSARVDVSDTHESWEPVPAHANTVPYVVNRVLLSQPLVMPLAVALTPRRRQTRDRAQTRPDVPEY